MGFIFSGTPCIQTVVAQLNYMFVLRIRSLTLDNPLQMAPRVCFEGVILFVVFFQFNLFA